MTMKTTPRRYYKNTMHVEDRVLQLWKHRQTVAVMRGINEQWLSGNESSMSNT